MTLPNVKFFLLQVPTRAKVAVFDKCITGVVRHLLLKWGGNPPFKCVITYNLSEFLEEIFFRDITAAKLKLIFDIIFKCSDFLHFIFQFAKIIFLLFL